MNHIKFKVFSKLQLLMFVSVRGFYSDLLLHAYMDFENHLYLTGKVL